MILVTGATGFVGNHLARFLQERGERIRLLVRESSDRTLIQGLDAELRTGDLRDPDSLNRAVHGCRMVFHVAASYRLWSRDPGEMSDSNVQGTSNMLAAAEAAKVERFVYTSSVGTIAPSPDGTPLTEDSPSRADQLIGPYKVSKYLAERSALSAATRGMPVVVVNPTAPVGERDLKPTPTGKIVQDFLAGRMPFYLDTGLNLVDVRDVARGHWLAAERGRVGERYLLGSENLTLQELLELLATVSDRRAPRRRLPYPAAWMIGAACTAWAQMSGMHPAVPLDGVRMARHRMFADCSKARRELGFEPGPVLPALKRAAEWFESRSRTQRTRSGPS